MNSFIAELSPNNVGTREPTLVQSPGLVIKGAGLALVTFDLWPLTNAATYLEPNLLGHTWGTGPGPGPVRGIPPGGNGCSLHV